MALVRRGVLSTLHGGVRRGGLTSYTSSTRTEPSWLSSILESTWAIVFSLVLSGTDWMCCRVWISSWIPTSSSLSHTDIQTVRRCAAGSGSAPESPPPHHCHTQTYKQSDDVLQGLDQLLDPHLLITATHRQTQSDGVLQGLDQLLDPHLLITVTDTDIQTYNQTMCCRVWIRS